MLAVTACDTTPTLPLPPPVAGVEAPDPAGVVTIRGQAQPRSFVAALNEARDAGVIGRADAAGDYSLQLAAQPGDAITVWQFIEADRSQVVDLVVPNP